MENILAKTEETVGTSEFFGEIWKSMLRTTRTRLSAIKYLDKKLPRDLEAAKKDTKVYPSRFQVKVQD